MGRRGIDDRDRSILRMLRDDARTAVSEIAKKLELSNTACHARVNKLETLGYIEKYTIMIGSKNTSFKDFQYIKIALHDNSSIKTDEMCEFLSSINNLVMLELLEGTYDLLAKFGFASNTEFGVIREKIRSHPLCKHTECIFSAKIIRDYGIDTEQLI